MRKREYESKLAAASRLIKEECKYLDSLEEEYGSEKYKNSIESYRNDLENKVFETRERIEGMKQMLLVIKNYKIMPKARKSNTLHDLYSRLNNSYYD